MAKGGPKKRGVDPFWPMAGLNLAIYWPNSDIFSREKWREKRGVLIFKRGIPKKGGVNKMGG